MDVLRQPLRCFTCLGVRCGHGSRCSTARFLYLGGALLVVAYLQA